MSRNRALKAKNRMNQQFPGNTIEFAKNNQPAPQRQVTLIPRSRNQEHLLLALMDNNQHIVVTVGPAGTGKTWLAMQMAVNALKQNRCERIILTRPAVGVDDERHGFLPGDLVSKMEPWTRPLLDVLREHYRAQDIMEMIDDQIIEISPLAYMRGRTFSNAWIIADEMQNATPSQVKMLMTRIGNQSRIVITGDIEQSDRKNNLNGLADLAARIRHNPITGIELCELNNQDIQRHPIIEDILDRYQDV